jgi:membrane protein involved in colicin uptake
VPYSLLEEERREREVEAREKCFMDEQRRREVDAQKKKEEDERVRAHFEKRREEERRREEDDRRRRDEIKRRDEEEKRRAENMRNAEIRRREEQNRREKEERERRERAKDLLELSSMARVLPDPFAASSSASWFSSGSTSATPSASRYSAVAVEDQKRKNPFHLVITYCMGFIVLCESVDSVL